SRVSFAALNETFARLQNRWLPRVLIVGAGDLGELVLRSIVRARPSAYRPVGFLDPDPGNRNRTMHSVRVLGSPDDLAKVTAERDVDVVVLALPPAHRDAADHIREKCEILGVPAYAAATFVEMHFAGTPLHLLPSLPDPDIAPKN
ncbi:MAG TPA: Gfo/Idh/MocA family oxidoreductase, partial [Chloroflexota bacterium]|nr:Gfo/Idh/MocA family oxidoreductase [Chloroflexota bacterium]